VSETPFVRVAVRGQEVNLEYRWIKRHNPGPLLVFLHEGLGSVSLWREFPHTLCEATGCGGLIYSRAGYGNSSPFWPAKTWPVDFMHVEAREFLPQVLASLDIDSTAHPPVLVGHSDGASIALIYASAFPDKVAGIVAMAPHTFVEPLTVESIAKIRDKFLAGDLPSRLGKYHRDVESVFWGWAGVWLRPEFARWEIQSLLTSIRAPVLLIQGLDDEYGTTAQIDGLLKTNSSATGLALGVCGHSPHIDQPGPVIAAIGRFLSTISPRVY
jgi:pimeloyl-ACP methyl ester carboxylesterase